MLINPKAIEKLYKSLDEIHSTMRKRLGRGLCATEKILFSHLDNCEKDDIERGVADINLRIDRVAMQDATAQMALLQFMTAGMEETAVPSTVHCDHLILAKNGAGTDLPHSIEQNKEVYNFLESVSNKYGIGFWKAGSGIIHQVVLENYAVPGTMIIGTDSHTPNAGGLGMLAIGVGGADAVDVMTGQLFGLRMPKIVGIHLKGKLSNWASPKDVILKVAEIMTVKGGTGKIVEYFGEGTKSISCTGKGTITNMGAEIGATTSVFPADDSMVRYLKKTDRKEIADLVTKYKEYLVADPTDDPKQYYDEIHEINLSELEPQVAGPHTPDLVRPISKLKDEIKQDKYPEELGSALIGSCTNSSYEDLAKANDLIKQGTNAGLKLKTKLFVSPGSERIYRTIERDGFVNNFEALGATVLANACGPCIGQWSRNPKENEKINNIITSFNRNFKKRNDGSPNTNGFIASPSVVVAMAFSGNMKFDPGSDTIKTTDGKSFKFKAPVGDELPKNGFISKDSGYQAPSMKGEVVVDPKSDRLALLEPFEAPNLDTDLKDMVILVKAIGKCTTDHVSPAGPWLKYRGHLDNISKNMYQGAVNAFDSKTGTGKNIITGEGNVPYNEIARHYKNNNINWAVVADENYGEGSSREHAAMEPRHMNGRAIIAKSFARIAETNLKKQGILALWLNDKSIYDKIREDDKITIKGVKDIAPKKDLTIEIKHSDNTVETSTVSHTLNELQIKWFKGGSALNYLKTK